MKPSLCSRCGKNVAVIFITKVEGGQTKTEGLCLKCAKELGIKPVNDMLTQLGVGDEDIDKLSEDLTSTLGNSDELASIASMLGAQSADENDGDDEDDAGRTATFPFLNQLFGAAPPAQKPEQGEAPPPLGRQVRRPQGPQAEIPQRLLHLPDPEGPGRQAGPAGGPRAGDPAGHPDPEPPPEEQPLPDR